MKLILKVVIAHWVAVSLLYLGWHELTMHFVAGVTAGWVGLLFYLEVKKDKA